MGWTGLSIAEKRSPGGVSSWRGLEMAAHSSVLAWRIPGTGEPGGLKGRTESDRTEVT